MSDILPTIGPITSDNESLIKLLKFTNLVRINGTHANLKWHVKISKKIKKINSDIKILLDLPGVKPRSQNTEDIIIKQKEKVIFHYNNYKTKTNYKKIKLSQALPKIKNNTKNFTISDGKYKMTIIKFGKNYVVGKSLDSFILKPSQGINIPNSIYNESKQKKIYFNFLKKYKAVKYDAIGLSFVQNEKVISNLKKFYKNTVIVSKIENAEGLKNVDQIAKNSHVIMIDRGDLGAEIGEENLFDSIIKISDTTKKYGKPLIMATENLNSMITRSLPTKSEIISIGFSTLLKADKIMLSDETATSKNWYKTIKWLNEFLYLRKKKIHSKIKYQNIDSQDLLWKSISKIENCPIVIFSRKGLAINRINQIKNDVDLVIFTDNKKTYTSCKFRSNTKSIFIKKFDKYMNNHYIYKILKKYKKIIFKKNKEAFLIYISYPRKGSRANTMTIISKKDF